MTARQQVMAGLVLTALAASLAISNLLPGWIIAVFLLLVGTGFTYYLAINEKRIKQIEDLVSLAEAVKKINNQQSAELIQMRQIYRTTLISIAGAIERRDMSFDGHAARVAAVAVLIGKKLGLQEHELRSLEYSAWLHDIGKLAAEEKDTETNEDTSDEGCGSEQHPVWGAQIFPDSDFFKPIREGIHYHHERYNGSGYPQGLAKNEIPFTARIIAVADFYDALTRLCPEEARLDHYHAVNVIKKATGTLFDPLVVTAFEEAEEDVRAIVFSPEIE